MLLEDTVYGTHTVTDPVIIDLLYSPALQRLRGVSQSGYRQPFFSGDDFSRFDHSVGAYLLLVRYGASIEEQIAGLIHDVSHSAFSHCIDYIMNTNSVHKQDYQDSIFTEFVNTTDIPDILSRHGYDPTYIFDETNFPLQERELPDLCADRIDYFLRELCSIGENNRVPYFLKNLKTERAMWIFDDFSVAREFAFLFKKINDTWWSGISSALMFKTTKDYLSHALSRNYISKDNLYTTDAEVLRKIEPYHPRDARLQLLFDRMNGKVAYTNDVGRSDGDEILCKSRVIDPLCRHDGDIVRVSTVDPEYFHVLQQGMKPRQYTISFSVD